MPTATAAAFQTPAEGQQQRAGEDEESRDRERGPRAGEVGEQPAERGEHGDGRLLADRPGRQSAGDQVLGREFEPTSQAIRKWVRQAELDEGKRSDGLTTQEREELTRLRRENARLLEEREILSKAAAWFAQETEKKSKRSSSS